MKGHQLSTLHNHNNHEVRMMMMGKMNSNWGHLISHYLHQLLLTHIGPDKVKRDHWPGHPICSLGTDHLWDPPWSCPELRWQTLGETLHVGPYSLRTDKKQKHTFAQKNTLNKSVSRLPGKIIKLRHELPRNKDCISIWLNPLLIQWTLPLSWNCCYLFHSDVSTTVHECMHLL